MDPTERLQILKRETVLLDPFQRVDVLTLNETLTFRTQTLRGFTLKPAKGRAPNYTNRANVTAVNVTTNRLIVVHARGAVHISGEVLDGKNKALLLLSLTESDLKASAGELSLVMGTRLLDAQEILAEPQVPYAPADTAPPVEKRRRKKVDDATTEEGVIAQELNAEIRDDVQPIPVELNVQDFGDGREGIDRPSSDPELTADQPSGGLRPDEADGSDVQDMPF